MPMTIAQWTAVLINCGVRRVTALAWAPEFQTHADPARFSAGRGELDEFLGQVLHESGMLERLEENLSYSSAERIRAVWPRRFPAVSDAAQFTRNARALANKVYGGRMGNTGPDDGWKYRGRGCIMVTGADNYRAVGRALGIDLLAKPDLLASPAVALRAAVAWWEGRIPDLITADDSIVAETKIVNGGTVGLPDRQKITALARAALAGAA